MGGLIKECWIGSSLYTSCLGNILNNFPADNTLINVARLAFGMNMFTTLPLEAFVCREVGIKREKGSHSYDWHADCVIQVLEILFWSSSPHSTVRHVVITTSLVGVSLLISLLTCNLGIVLELTGGFSATMLAYILPPLCYLKLAKDSIWQLNKIPHWATLIFGLVIMIFSTSFSIQKVVLGTSDPGPTCDLWQDFEQYHPSPCTLDDLLFPCYYYHYKVLSEESIIHHCIFEMETYTAIIHHVLALMGSMQHIFVKSQSMVRTWYLWISRP